MNKLIAPALGAVLAGAVLFGALAPSREAAAADDTASISLSLWMPGVGEWYNAGFSGGFPLVECILGWICPCVHIASIVDAAAGKTDDSLRFDFWASPN